MVDINNTNQCIFSLYWETLLHAGMQRGVTKKTVSSSLSNIRALKNIVASGGRCDILTSALEKHKSTVNLSRILCRKTVLIFCGGHSLTLNAAHLTEFQMHHEKMRLKKTTHPQVKVICQQCICVCIRHL